MSRQLSRDEINEILTSPYETGYTYSKSYSYNQANKSMDFEHPRMCRRIPTAPPEFEPDERVHRRQREEYRSMVAQAQSPSYNYQLREFGPLEPKKRWYYRNYLSEMGMGSDGGWASWAVMKTLYSVQVVVVFVAAVTYYVLKKTFNTGWLYWLVNWLVIKPIFGPYIMMVRKAKWVYRATNYAYNSPR